MEQQLPGFFSDVPDTIQSKRIYIAPDLGFKDDSLPSGGDGRRAEPAMMNDDNDDALRANDEIARKRRPEHFVAEEA